MSRELLKRCKYFIERNLHNVEDYRLLDDIDAERAKPEPEPELLTDEEIIQLAAETVTFSWDENDLKFARAIEQKVRSKMKWQTKN